MAQNGGRLYGLFDELPMCLSSFNTLSKNVKVGDSRELQDFFSLCNGKSKRERERLVLCNF